MPLQLFDRVPTGKFRILSDGSAIAQARAARMGIQMYSGDECGKPELDQVRVYRPENEVFHKDSMESYAHAAVVIDHPKEGNVTAINWKKLAVGYIGEGVIRDGGYVVVPLALKDSAAVDLVKDGQKVEVSMGYECELDFTSGKTPSGEAYDAVCKNIRVNHLALVDVARGGSGCRLGDRNTSGQPGDGIMPEPTLRTVIVDGLSISTTEQGAQAIEKLTRQLADGEKKLTDTIAGHQTVIAAKDKELGTKDAEIKKLTDEKVDATKLDDMVSERAEVVGKARAVLGDSFDPKGKSIPDIRKAVAVAKFGESNVKDKSEDYIRALFDGVTAQVKAQDTDPFRSVMSNGGGHTTTIAADASNAYAEMTKNLTGAWQNPGGKKEAA